jgi:hypothetical protein
VVCFVPQADFGQPSLPPGGRLAAYLPACDVDVALPGDGCDVFHGEVAPRCLGNVLLIGSGNRAGFLLAWLLLVFWRGELNGVKAERFQCWQNWDAQNSWAGQSIAPWPGWAWIFLQSKDDAKPVLVTIVRTLADE